MKRIILVLICSLLTGVSGEWLQITTPKPTPPTVAIKPEGNNATIIEVNITGLEMSTEVRENQSWTILRLINEPAVTGEVGLPQLPVLIKNLALPDNATVRIEVIDAEFQTIPNVLVYPAQEPLTDRARPEWQINQKFYATDQVYPQEIAEIKLQTTWRDLPFTTLVINPVRYNPAKRELLVATRLKVKVHHTGIFPRHLIEPWALPILKTLIDNPERFNLTVNWLTDPGVRYLIIAHSNYTGSWLDSLTNWHQIRGIPTRLIAKSFWTAQEVKDSILAEYNRNNPKTLRWVLLIGEYDEVPGYTNYPSVSFSDMWYGDLEPFGGDNYFELGIGRFSPSSITDLENQIKKTLRFERNPAGGNWTEKVSLAAHSEDYPGKYSACTRGIYHFPYALYHYTFDTIMGGTTGNNGMVTSAINEGRVVINYRGHGSEFDWSGWDADGASWTVDHIQALNNDSFTPVVINCCCLNHVISYSTCLGEAWLRKYPGGAVASLGATEPSFTSPNHAWDSIIFRSLGDTFTINIPGVGKYTCPAYDLGGILCNANAYIQKFYSSQGGTENARMYLWLGDPALTVWTGPLVNANVNHPLVVPLGPYQLNVTVTKQGNPVKNALVCASKQGDFYEFGYTDNNGQVSLPIHATTPGEFLLVVSGQGFPPYQGTILALSPNTPYVVYLRSIIDDASPGGNGDGSINPGEAINLPVWVKNFGDSTGRSVTGKLTTPDPFISLTDSLKEFGDVLGHDSAWTGNNGFKFNVAPACTNGHKISFTLSCRDSKDSLWLSYFSLRVGAPELEYAGIVVIDTAQGGNRNFKLDPGESADLFVALHNIGFGNANNVNALLRSADSRMIVTDSTGLYDQIMPESTKTNSMDRYRVTTLTMPMETSIPCTLYLTAQGGYSKLLPFTILVGEIRISDPIPDTGGTTINLWAYDDIDTFYQKHPQFEWVEIRNLGTKLNLGDDQTVQINLPLSFGPFIFYGQSYDKISICSNGWVTPGTTTVNFWTNDSLPNTRIPRLLAVNWDDWNPQKGGGVWYYYDSLNHRFIVEWDSIYYVNSSEWEKFQIILYDTTTTDGDCEFKFQYLTANRTYSSTIGEQDHTATRYIQIVYNNTYHRGAAPIAPQRAILFSPVSPIGVQEPKAYHLPQRLSISLAPNPVFQKATIHYQLPVTGKVKLSIYDPAGRLVRTLVQTQLPAGSYSVVWDGKDDNRREVANGIYIYRLEAPNGTATIKMVLIR